MSETPTSKGWRAARTVAANRYFVPLLLIVVFFGLGQLLIRGYGSLPNVGSILAAASLVTLATVAQVLVVLSGGDGIDLSVGAVMSMGALLGPMMATSLGPAGLVLGAAAVMALGSGFGLLSALGIRFGNTPPLIMTLIMASVVDGFTLATTQGQPSGTIPGALLSIGRPIVPPLSWILVLTLALMAGVGLLLSRTRIGRGLFLVGSNRRAARLCGLPIGVTVASAYMASGAISAFAGYLLAGYSGGAMLKMASGYTLLSVAAAVIGGTKLSGGEGTIFGGFLGAVILTVLANLLLAVNLPSGVRVFVQGVVLLLVLVAYSRGTRLRA